MPTWDSLPNDIKLFIIKMNPSFKEIHGNRLNETLKEIKLRRRDFSCTTCTRMTIFSGKSVKRSPSIRLFATSTSDSKIVRVFGECSQHRTSNSMGIKFIIPREYDHVNDKMFEFIHKYIPCDSIMMHHGLDENDIMIRLRVLDGVIFSLYEEIKRPRWIEIKD